MSNSLTHVAHYQGVDGHRGYLFLRRNEDQYRWYQDTPGGVPLFL
jgi:hypothetical protein